MNLIILTLNALNGITLLNSAGLYIVRTNPSMFFLLSRQTESARDHKFHSGYAHSLMVDHRQGSTLFRTCIKLRVSKEIVVHLSSPQHNSHLKASHKYVFRNEAVSVSSERNLLTLNGGYVCRLCFQPICQKAFFFSTNCWQH